jgi:hypothetical protein
VHGAVFAVCEASTRRLKAKSWPHPRYGFLKLRRRVFTYADACQRHRSPSAHRSDEGPYGLENLTDGDRESRPFNRATQAIEIKR